MKILLIDNYDSFTYNLYHYLEALRCKVDVVRNDRITSKEIIKKKYKKIVISPGPGNPNQAGNCLKIVKDLFKKIPILGVCLGHQAIAEYFGANLLNLDLVNHGVSNEITITENDYIFNSLPKKFNVGLYHSWFVDKKNFPKELIVTSNDNEGNIYSFKHSKFDIRGVQFHPESIMTEYGLKIIENWVTN